MTNLTAAWDSGQTHPLDDKGVVNSESVAEGRLFEFELKLKNEMKIHEECGLGRWSCCAHQAFEILDGGNQQNLNLQFLESSMEGLL
jgi:hypothetical protein